jgi:hypothetical protein
MFMLAGRGRLAGRFRLYGSTSEEIVIQGLIRAQAAVLSASRVSHGDPTSKCSLAVVPSFFASIRSTAAFLEFIH